MISVELVLKTDLGIEETIRIDDVMEEKITAESIKEFAKNLIINDYVIPLEGEKYVSFEKAFKVTTTREEIE